MANINITLKRIFVGTVLLSIVLAAVIGYCYFSAKKNLAKRRIIYLKAYQQAQVEKQKQLLEYKKQYQERKRFPSGN